jgi:hypothetical protein
MPNAPRVWTSKAFEAGNKYPSARVVDRNGNVIVQADCGTNATVRVYDLGSLTPNTAVFSNVVAVSSVVYDTLQTWDIDDDGFNFQTEIGSNDVEWEGGHTYRVSSLLPHLTQGLIPVVHDIKIEELMSL